jgi:hypothetical protein
MQRFAGATKTGSLLFIIGGLTPAI